MVHNIDPVLVTIGPLSIRYYGLIYMMGFVLGYLFLKYAVIKKQTIPHIKQQDLDDYIFYAVIADIIGARLFEVLFYEPSYYFSHPLKIFAVWEGGLSFHGALVGILIATLIFCKKKKIPFLQWGDLLTIPASFALFLGRIANFINGELYGKKLEGKPWYGVQFIRTDELLNNPYYKADPSLLPYRIPTQILESFKNLIIFFVVLYLWKKKDEWKLVHGVMGWTFLFLYGVFRFIIEFFKDVYTDTFLGLTTGQLLNIPMILAGMAGYYYSFIYLKKNNVQK